MIGFDWYYVIDFFPKILQALPVTLLIVCVAAVAGLILGALMAIVRIERLSVLHSVVAVIVSFVRGTPIYIQMFLIYYGLPAALLVFGINIVRADKMLFVLIAYSINAAGFFSEIIRSSVLSVPHDQWDAALSIGHTRPLAYIRIIIPQAVVIAIPSTGVMITGLLQDTSLTFAMGVIDVLGKATSLSKHTGHSLEAFSVVAMIFVALSTIVTLVFTFLAKKTRTQNLVVRT
ncbi:MAG: amino acid ABC transporter permease [Spirochaetaceae bacterium]|nr:amino acid ABC transporter permease [Spirochaetaceae bacterium]